MITLLGDTISAIGGLLPASGCPVSFGALALGHAFHH